jgi:predicted RNA-binding Zn-ribbon protein involved in translation (DUF1610 family)
MMLFSAEIRWVLRNADATMTVTNDATMTRHSDAAMMNNLSTPVINRAAMEVRARRDQRQLLIKRWPKPAIKLEGNALLYKPSKPRQYAKWKLDLLPEFTKLATVPESAFAEEVSRYAAKWGVLQLCKAHQAPESHRAELFTHTIEAAPRAAKESIATGVCRAGVKNGRFAEPVSAWRFWAVQASTLLKAIDADNRGLVLDRTDWLRLAITRPRESPRLLSLLDDLANLPQGKTLPAAADQSFVDEEERAFEGRLGLRFPWNGGDQLTLISEFVNRWLDLAGLQLRALAEDGRVTMQLVPALNSGWLFAAIAARIAFIATGAPGLYTCSSCKQPYAPEHVPNNGENTFCPNCGEKAAWRAASAKYRRSHPNKKKRK